MALINGKIIPLVHTICASSAFLAALAVGYKLHFYKIVSNAHYGYPDEWFPSVSATIGDRYPERSVFQILIALTAFPRFLLLLGHYYLNHSVVTLLVGLVRTISCGGWVYITSTDDHDIHDIFMILYIVLTLPWDTLVIYYSPYKKFKILMTSTFFGLLVPMLYWYYQHKVMIIPGAYSIYAYFEWSLIFLDIGFDGCAYTDFKAFSIELGPSTPGDTSLFRSTAQKKKTAATTTTTTPEVVTKKDDKTKKSEKVPVASHPGAIRNVVTPVDFEFSYDSLLYLLTQTFNSFILWTALTALTCSIWHFPLWYMGISGYEAATLGYFGAILLYLPFAPTATYMYGTLLGGLLAVGAYVRGRPEDRLITTCVGTAILVATFVQNLRTIKDTKFSAAFAMCWLLGLVVSVTLKMGFYSNNPLWPIFDEYNNGYNKTGLVGIVLFGMLTPYVNRMQLSQAGSPNENVEPSFFRKIVIAMGAGSLLFGIHQLMTDGSTIIYWAWEGWNQHGQGPLQWPWTALTCFIMLLATVTSLCFVGRPLIPISLLVLSTTVLYLREITQWPKYICGGLVYVTAMIWLVPHYFASLANIRSIGIFVFGFFIYLLFIFAHVWTVAYAFVPGGWLLRERLHVVLAASSFLIILGAIAASGAQLKGTGYKMSSKFKRIISLFTLLIIAMIGGFSYRVRPIGTPQPYHPDSNLITAGIWTIHFGLDNDMWASEDRMSSLIRDMELDVVGLLETDTQRITMGNRDLTNKLAHDLNMYADFGPGPNKHTWGCVLLSKFPIVNSTHHLLPSPAGELSPAIHATLLTYNDTLVDVFVFHSGQEEDELDRLLQSHKMAELMGSTNRPTILLSYLVTDPLEGNYNTYVSEKSGMHDIDPSDDERWCEYILYKNIRRTGYARVSRGTITDTELQVGKFQVLPRDRLEELGDSIYEFVHEDEPEDDDLKFPEKFEGDGEDGHRYHVFDKPRYFPL